MEGTVHCELSTFEEWHGGDREREGDAAADNDINHSEGSENCAISKDATSFGLQMQSEN